MSECKNPLMGAVPTAEMVGVGLSWPGVLDVAQHCVNLLETQGANALDIVKGMLLMVKAVTLRDYPTIFTTLGELRGDVKELIAAVKAEFNLD